MALKTTEEDKKKHREGAAAKLIWLHQAVLSDLDGIFILKEEKKNGSTGFLKRPSLMTDFGKSLIKQRSALRPTTGHWCVAGVAPHTNRMPRAVAIWLSSHQKSTQSASNLIDRRFVLPKVF